MVLFESLSYSILCEHSVMKRNLVFSISGCIKYDRGYESITCVSMWCNVFLVPMFYRDLKVMTSVIIYHDADLEEKQCWTFFSLILK